MRALVAFLILLLVGCIAHPMSHNDWGARYVGATYVNSPLGEGAGVDADPLIRDDAFDCTTFVETVLACGDVDRLTNIRYRGGDVGFLNRNHFIETDWLENNADLVRNVSRRYGRTATRTVVIDKASWLRTVHGIEADFAPVVVGLEYLPYSVVRDGIDVDAPHVVLFVVDNSNLRDKIGTDLGVVHMGFLLPGGVLRHASSARGAVVDVDFAEYARERAQNKQNLGVVLLEVKDD